MKRNEHGLFLPHGQDEPNVEQRLSPLAERRAPLEKETKREPRRLHACLGKDAVVTPATSGARDALSWR